MKAPNVLGWVVLVSAVALAGCDRPPGNAEYKDPTDELPAKFKTQEAVPKPDFREAAKDPEFQQAIKEVAALFGAAPQSLSSQGEGQVITGGVSFDVPREKVEALLFKAHTKFLAQGYYLFRYDQNFGINGLPDKVGLLPTRGR